MAITINGTSGVVSGLTELNDTGSATILGRRNLIINGAMQVAQRGTSETITTSGVFTSDRFKVTKAGTDELVATLTQDTSAPSGFASSTKVAVGTVETAVAADESLNCRYEVEAQDLQGLANGTSDAKSLTLSFWVKSSVTGTYTVALYKNDNTARLISATYTISAADTWEQKTLTFAGDTSGGGIDNNTGSGLSIVWWLTVGSNKTGTDSTSWINYVEGGYAYGHTADIASTASATWQITGVQLEVGSVATPFEHRSYGEELALCQRYFYRTEQSASGAFTYGSGPVQSTISSRISFPLPVSMRATPSVSYNYIRIYTGNSAVAVASFSGVQNNGTSVGCSVNVASGLTTGEGSVIIDNGGGTSYIAWDAEL